MPNVLKAIIITLSAVLILILLTGLFFAPSTKEFVAGFMVFISVLGFISSIVLFWLKILSNKGTSYLISTILLLSSMLLFLVGMFMSGVFKS